MTTALCLFALLLSVDARPLEVLQQKRSTPPNAPFTTPLTLAQMTNKQAVVNTSAGTFVIDLKPDVAPNHVGYFMKLAGEGAYAGTVFHRVIRNGIIQGGDPLSKDPAKASVYGTGGLGVLKAEIGSERATRGAVAAVIQPGKTRQRRGAVLRLRHRPAGTRRQVHDLRPRVGRARRGDEDLGSAGDSGRDGNDARRDHLGHDPRNAATGAGTVRG